jgi:Glycosyl hydrolases family 16
MRRAILLTLLLTGCSTIAAHHSRVMFDDFSYTSTAELASHGWIVRTEQGWPGVPGASWGNDSISFTGDPAMQGNRLLRMSSSTDGNGANTRQAQICHQRKYLDGTYAARVRFTDEPVAGPNGDQIVETFYMISPLKAPMDPDYSELDFEYLPNGGWKHTGATMFETTWETFSPEPDWKADNVSSNEEGSLVGWHTLVTQVANEHVQYWIDGKPVADHVGRYYPESMMSIDFNLWFVRTGLIASADPRRYEEDVDWVFFSGDALTPDRVEEAVADLRRHSISFRDTVAAPVPPLTSPCNF